MHRLGSHRRIVRAILTKDLLEALRDSRIVVALLTPVVIGLLYSVVVKDDARKPQAKVGYVAAGKTALPQAIGQTAGSTVKLSFRLVGDEATLRRLVADKGADIGLVVPPGFDAAARKGGSPTLRVLLPPSPSYGGDYVAAILERSVQRLAGRGPAAEVVRVTVPLRRSSGDLVLERLGIRRYLSLWATVFLLVMVAVNAVPTVLAQEVQTRTLDALLLIASYADVIIAKALFGIVYCLAGVPLMLVLTRMAPADGLGFALITLLSAVCLVGFGLLLGSLLNNPNQLNTWGTLIMVPFVGAPVVAGIGLPPAANAVLFAIPTTHTVRLGANAVVGSAIFQQTWASYAVLGGWSVVVYGLLFWRLRRMET